METLLIPFSFTGSLTHIVYAHVGSFYRVTDAQSRVNSAANIPDARSCQQSSPPGSTFLETVIA